ncbi:immunity protein 19 [Pedobacter steynii]|nr:Imm19 family immunity protein [Pedobacter steynii]NQX40921.1 immunity protein 19 [Pedobacter steynii]
MKLNLSNPDFCIYLLSQFPFAADDEKEMMLSDYMMEQFEMPAKGWLEELSGQTDENERELDPWNGYTYVHEVNDKVTLFAEFHSYNTVYFFNDIYLGNTGGHFHLSLLSWTELKEIISNDKAELSPLFLLLLPLVIGNESERAEIESKISEALQQTALDLNDPHLGQITKFLTRHLIFGESHKNRLMHKEHIGLTTSRNHSERNQEHSEEELKQINEIISLASGA